jgi:hypothetical protein
LKELVLKEIKTALSSCSLTLDGWFSDATEGYLGVTFHFIDNDFEFRSFVLNLKLCSGTLLIVKECCHIEVARMLKRPGTGEHRHQGRAAVYRFPRT